MLIILCSPSQASKYAGRKKLFFFLFAPATTVFLSKSNGGIRSFLIRKAMLLLLLFLHKCKTYCNTHYFKKKLMREKYIGTKGEKAGGQGSNSSQDSLQRGRTAACDVCFVVHLQRRDLSVCQHHTLRALRPSLKRNNASSFCTGYDSIIGPITGIDSNTRATMGKKLPNKFSAPKPSIQSPIKHQRSNTNNMPTKKHSEARWRAMKNVLQRAGPITMATPATKNTLPIVSKMLSSSRTTPIALKKTPRPVSATPIFVASLQLYSESITLTERRLKLWERKKKVTTTANEKRKKTEASFAFRKGRGKKEMPSALPFTKELTG